MSEKLIVVVGPSGAGKDSLMHYARQRLQDENGIVFAHRYITRLPESQGENHVALSPEEFDARRRQGLFAVDWRSHGYAYAVGVEIDLWLGKGLTVVFNGSRSHLPVLTRRYPGLRVLHITASDEVLVERLRRRSRESESEIHERLGGRTLPVIAATETVEILNDDRLEDAGARVVAQLLFWSAVDMQTPHAAEAS